MSKCEACMCQLYGQIRSVLTDQVSLDRSGQFGQVKLVWIDQVSLDRSG